MFNKIKLFKKQSNYVFKTLINNLIHYVKVICDELKSNKTYKILKLKEY